VTDLGLLAADSLAWLAREARETDDQATARALHRDVLAGVDKAAKHRPTAAQAANLVDPASFPELGHETLAKLRRYKDRLQRQRDETVQQQLAAAAERGGDYLTGATDTLRAIGELPAPGDGGDDDGPE
jgi:hypothetical protein